MAADHTATYIDRTAFDHTVRCSCGWMPDAKRKYATRQMVEDEFYRHYQMVERVRKHLAHGKGTPSLASQRDYYRLMANDPNVPEKDREQWKMLADGLDRRLGKPVTAEEQPELFL